VLMNLIWSVYDLVSTGRPTILYGLFHSFGDSQTHVFDSVTLTLYDGSVYTICYDPDNPENYHFTYPDGDVILERAAVLEENPPSIPPREDMSCVELRAGRSSKPSEVIYGLIELADGRVDRDFINHWHGFMAESDDHDARFDGIPYEESTSGDSTGRPDRVRRVTDWMKRKHFSFGEVQLLMQLVAMSCRFGVLLIDNAEMGLHPAIQIAYMALVTECYRRGTQVLFVTNSPEMFDRKWRQSNDLWDITHPRTDEEY